MPTNAIVSLVVLLICVVIGFKFKINIGLLAICGAFVVGVLFVGMSPSDVLMLWSTNLFITLFTITMFFGIAVRNGTLLAISNRIIYPFRNMPAVIPIVLAVVCFLMAFIGPGSIVTFAVMAPVCMLICKRIGVKYALVPLMIGTSSAGAWGPIAVNGILQRNILRNSGFDESVIDSFANKEFFSLLFVCFLAFFIAYFILGAFKAKKLEMEKPEPMNKQQKQTCVLILILLILVAVLPFLKQLIHAEWLNKASSWFNVYMVCVILTVVAMFLKLTNFKAAMSGVPWDTIVMLCGVSILISLANQTGATAAITDMFSKLEPGTMNTSIGLFSGTLSVFTSTLVVMPTVCPIIQGLTATAGVSGGALLCIMINASVATGYSPLSLIGGLTMAGLPEVEDEKAHRKMFLTQIVIAVASFLLVMVLTWLGVFNIF